MSKSTQRKVSAVSSGKLAARTGQDKKSNPFKKGQPLNACWWAGFQKEQDKLGALENDAA